MKIVIIGAGIAGLSIGLRLVQAGADVTVLERTQAGRGATWASAGMIAVSSEHDAGAAALAPLALEAASQWPAFAREIEQLSGISVGYRKTGALMAALSEAELETLRERAAQTGAGIVGANEVRAREPELSPDVVGGLWDGREAYVDNRAIARALAFAFVRAGGKLQTNEAVVRVEIADGKAYAVRSPFDIHFADAIVLAAGAWSARLEGVPQDALPPVRPIKGEMIAIAPKGQVRIPAHLVWGNEIYLVPRGGRLLVGATMEEAGFDTGLSDSAVDWLSSRAVRLMPSLADWQITDHWAGLRPGSPDGLPILGETSVRGLFAATGQFRNGILLAPPMADALARLILDGKSPETVAGFSPARFRSVAKSGHLG